MADGDGRGRRVAGGRFGAAGDGDGGISRVMVFRVLGGGVGDGEEGSEAEAAEGEGEGRRRVESEWSVEWKFR